MRYSTHWQACDNRRAKKGYKSPNSRAHGLKLESFCQGRRSVTQGTLTDVQRPPVETRRSVRRFPLLEVQLMRLLRDQATIAPLGVESHLRRQL
jgi:hypothetical protein